MGIVIEQAEAVDAPGLIACIDAAYAGYLAQGMALPDMSDGIAEAIRTSKVWAARTQGQIVGGLILSIDGPEAYLENIAVHPAHGGLGIGRQLLEVATTAANAVGCTVMKLTTHADMPHNIALYQHFGWHVVRQEGEKVAMECTL